MKQSLSRACFSLVLKSLYCRSDTVFNKHAQLLIAPMLIAQLLIAPMLIAQQLNSKITKTKELVFNPLNPTVLISGQSLWVQLYSVPVEFKW